MDRELRGALSSVSGSGKRGIEGCCGVCVWRFGTVQRAGHREPMLGDEDPLYLSHEKKGTDDSVSESTNAFKLVRRVKRIVLRINDRTTQYMHCWRKISIELVGSRIWS